jgi:hypothetical protein
MYFKKWLQINQAIVEDTKIKHKNITTKLNWKLYTNVIKRAKLTCLDSDRQRF